MSGGLCFTSNGLYSVDFVSRAVFLYQSRWLLVEPTVFLCPAETRNKRLNEVRLQYRLNERDKKNDARRILHNCSSLNWKIAADTRRIVSVRSLEYFPATHKPKRFYRPRFLKSARHTWRWIFIALYRSRHCFGTQVFDCFAFLVRWVVPRWQWIHLTSIEPAIIFFTRSGVEHFVFIKVGAVMVRQLARVAVYP